MHGTIVRRSFMSSQNQDLRDLVMVLNEDSTFSSIFNKNHLDYFDE